ncbi:FAD-dependent oxidoreductase [Methylobacterium sp. C25]|uniref:FAD-dependent oxidoreductase n=1 Tax=Methylobacterium sp. C25 TaxID=2721622 RepID=UPI001F1D56F8|nr:FAD-dependent oxidoreductase [Methylobacterium sp. C25]MCE4226268.1 FAD-dependent oxidoreductase [Methylobacterium sp. C25]
MSDLGHLPIVVVGAGPVGLAAAAHLVGRGLDVKVYEAEDTVGAHVRQWGHVRLFSSWKYNVDAAARDLLEKDGWQEPDGEGYPTGAELVERYLVPLSRTPELGPVIETGLRVAGIGREGLDKANSRGRAERPFVLTLVDTAGGTRQIRARAVIDAAGTWGTPNPLGADGRPAAGEIDASEAVAYGIPDVLGRDRATYAGRTTVVVGAGHSAANVLIDLARLAEDAPGTASLWVTRGSNLARVYGGGSADQLAERGALGGRLRVLVQDGRLTLVTGFAVSGVVRAGARFQLSGETADGRRMLDPVDRIIVATGQRPDLGPTRELRLDLDPGLESVRSLGPLIDPNLHSCGSVPPHGHRQLSHPEPGFYTVGIKSYGRAPTFLMMTGYEQVRSVAAALAGDLIAADDVHLTLPETGVCTLLADQPDAACCGPSSDGHAAAAPGRPPTLEPRTTSCCGTAA